MNRRIDKLDGMLAAMLYLNRVRAERDEAQHRMVLRLALYVIATLVALLVIQSI